MSAVNPSDASSRIPAADDVHRPYPPRIDSAASSTGPSNASPAIGLGLHGYLPPRRSSNMQSSHSYSRSSPAGMDHKYIPFSNPNESPRFPSGGDGSSSAAGKIPILHTPTGAPSHSPLALSDIRPRPDLHLPDDLSGAGGPYNDGATLQQTASSYLAPWAIYAYDWCNWPVTAGSSAGKMAIGSYLEDPHNFIQILDTQIEPQEPSTPGSPGYGLDFIRVAEATCSYPVTRILWEPPSSSKQSTDLLATSGDHLRLWSLPATTTPTYGSSIHRTASGSMKQPAAQKLTPLALLSNSKTPEHTAPLTSLDWNKLSPKLIITSSIDTTCTIWDIPTLTAKTQLIAHDKEVFDVRFCAGSVDTFVSCGADGSVRMFDLRSLEHSTIIYEPSDKTDRGSSPGSNSPSTSQTMPSAPPLLRLAASPHDSHLLATFAQDSKIIRILDHRQPGQALLELHGHSAAINCIEWSPSRRGMLSSGADDSLVLLWDLINSQNAATLPTPNGNPSGGAGGEGNKANMKGPAASWRCDFEVGNLSWAPSNPLMNQGGDWLGVTGGRAVWGVKV